MNLLDILKSVDIDVCDMLATPDQVISLTYDFEISPKEFLNYSKQDLSNKTQRGKVNALTNAKRAIDCQIDKILFSLGIVDYKKFQTIINQFIDKVLDPTTDKNIYVKLRLLQALNLAPAFIISKVRKMRHELEHNYKVPENENVSEAIDIAELFIHATDSRIKNLQEYTITDFAKARINGAGSLRQSLYIQYNEKKFQFEISIWQKPKKRREYTFNHHTTEFYYLLRAATSFEYEEDFKIAIFDMLKGFKHPVPISEMKLEIGFIENYFFDDEG